MDIQHLDLLPAGLVEATCTGAEALTNDYGESLVTYWKATAKTGESMENLRIYCKPLISPRSKLGRLLAALEIETEGLNTEKQIAKAITGQSCALEVVFNEAGYVRLILPGTD
jgi:hypothetical protein